MSVRSAVYISIKNMWEFSPAGIALKPVGFDNCCNINYIIEY